MLGALTCRIIKESMLYEKWARPQSASEPRGAEVAGGRSAPKSIQV
jgi:hypothetical protein